MEAAAAAAVAQQQQQQQQPKKKKQEQPQQQEGQQQQHRKQQQQQPHHQRYESAPRESVHHHDGARSKKRVRIQQPPFQKGAGGGGKRGGVTVSSPGHSPGVPEEEDDHGVAVVAVVAPVERGGGRGGGGEGGSAMQQSRGDDDEEKASSAASVGALGTTTANRSNGSSPSDAVKAPLLSNGRGVKLTGGGGGRRERKQKFDVRKLLNIRGTTPTPTSTSATFIGKPQQQLNQVDGGGGGGGNVIRRRMPSDSTNDVKDCDANDVNHRTRRSGRVKAATAAAAATVQPTSEPSSITTSPATNGTSSAAVGLACDSRIAGAKTAAKGKESLLKEESPESSVVLGKRERKRKKFWDEQEPTLPNLPPPKVAKKSEKKSLGSSASLKPKHIGASPGSKRELKVSSDSVKHKRDSATLAQQPPQQNGKTLNYLLFDFSLDPAEIAEQMVEGVNIPGPGVPIPVDSSSLPDGWEKRVIQRGIGITKGKWDVFIQSPSGKSFRSKIELQKHFDEKKLSLKSDLFDFSLDEHLKRLRQIWKQYVLNNQNREAISITSTVNSGLGEVQVRNRSTDLAEGTMELGDFEPCSSPGPDIGVESETGQGIRCSIEKCGKLFRNDRLLQMHIKHYHPQVFETLPTITKSLTDLQSKAAFSDDGSTQPLSTSVLPRAPSPALATSGIEGSALTMSKNVDKKRRLSSDRHVEKKQKVSPTLPEESDESKLPNNRRGRPTGRKHSTAPSEDDEVFQPSGRNRNDSILSVGSDNAMGAVRGEVEDALSGNCTAIGPLTPPTFRISKRRQAQLKKKKISPVLRKVDDTPEGYLDEFMNFLGTNRVGGDPSSTDLAGSTPSSYPPSEMDASIVSEHLTSEEVVNCTCRRTEEDGLMIQCDICLCWQHGICLGLDEEDQVPEKYVCQICRNPPGGRMSSLFNLDQDWLKEGKFNSVGLPAIDDVIPSHHKRNSEREIAFKKLSELMADLSNLSKVLYSLRVKLHVASQPNNSKVFMWSSPWEKEETVSIFQEPRQNSNFIHASNARISCTRNGNLDSQQDILQSFCAPASRSEHHRITEACNYAENAAGPYHNCAKQQQLNNETAQGLNGNAIDITSSTNPDDIVDGGEGDVDREYPKLFAHSEGQKKRADVQGSGIRDVDAEKNGSSASHPENDDDEELDILDPSMIPSVSEVERLLPSIIEASLAGHLPDSVEDLHSSNADILQNHRSSGAHLQHKPIIIPEQKRIDKEECRLNLLDHIEKMQLEINDILNKTERTLDSLETEGDLQIPVVSPDRLVSKTKAIAIMLLQDLSVTRKLIGAV